MEELLLLLLQLGGDLLIQVVVEVLWEIVAAGYKVTFGRPDRSIVWASIGYFVVGARFSGGCPCSYGRPGSCGQVQCLV